MMSNSDFENIYDRYSSMLYGFALQIGCLDKTEAEDLLISTFKKIHEKNISQQKYPAYFITLMNLTIKTAQELYPIKFKDGFRLKQFENLPMINQIICNQISLQGYCKEKGLTQQEGLQIIRKEFSKIRTFETEKGMLQVQ